MFLRQSSSIAISGRSFHSLALFHFLSFGRYRVKYAPIIRSRIVRLSEMIPLKSNQYANKLIAAIRKKQIEVPRDFHPVIDASFLLAMIFLMENPNMMSIAKVNIVGHMIGHLPFNRSVSNFTVQVGGSFAFRIFHSLQRPKFWTLLPYETYNEKER